MYSTVPANRRWPRRVDLLYGGKAMNGGESAWNKQWLVPLSRVPRTTDFDSSIVQYGVRENLPVQLRRATSNGWFLLSQVPTTVWRAIKGSCSVAPCCIHCTIIGSHYYVLF